jgi:hypothetical protein
MTEQLVTTKRTLKNILGAFITIIFNPTNGRNAVKCWDDKTTKRDFSKNDKIMSNVSYNKKTKRFWITEPDSNDNFKVWDTQITPTKANLITNVRCEELTKADVIELKTVGLDAAKATVIKGYWADYATLEDCVAYINKDGYGQRTIAKYYKVFNFLEKEEKALAQ